MDKETALGFVERIEAHRSQEEAIWDEMRGHADYGQNEDRAIDEILDWRRQARQINDEAMSALAAFDWVDDGTGNFVPHEEAAE